MGLTDMLAVSLQFSRSMPDEKAKAVHVLASSAAKSVREYVEKFRGGLASSVLNSIKYSFSVFLVPKVANRQNAADIAVQFVKVDEASTEELERLEKLNILIREKHIPIVNLGLFKPGEVVREIRPRLTHPVDLHVHTCAWRYYRVRPPQGDPHPERTRAEYCVYDATHEDYIYTRAWVEKLTRDLANPTEYERVVGRPARQAGVAN